MPRKSNAKSASPEGEGHHFTSGDMARMLHVDLKTIHNWVNQGHITGRRTAGRHLRFDRTEVVRFMREYGYPIPDSVGAGAPRVVLDQAPNSRPALKKCLTRGIQLAPCEGLYACALAVASGDQELVVFDLDKRGPKEVAEFVKSVRSWELSKGLVLAGVSRKPATRKAFLKAGGDVALATAKEAELRAAARFFTGSAVAEPASLEMAEQN